MIILSAVENRNPAIFPAPFQGASLSYAYLSQGCHPGLNSAALSGPERWLFFFAAPAHLLDKLIDGGLKLGKIHAAICQETVQGVEFRVGQQLRETW